MQKLTRISAGIKPFSHIGIFSQTLFCKISYPVSISTWDFLFVINWLNGLWIQENPVYIRYINAPLMPIVSCEECKRY